MKDEPFPYFCILIGGIVIGIASFAPSGKTQDSAINLGGILASGGLTAYGLQLKYGDEEARKQESKSRGDSR